MARVLGLMGRWASRISMGADIGRLAAAIGRDPRTAGNFRFERLGCQFQTV